MEGTTMASINDLIEKKKGLVAEAVAIRDRVYNEQDGEWRGDDAAKFDEITGNSDKVQADIERLSKLDASERALADLEKPNGRRTEPRQPNAIASFGKATPRDSDLALRGWLLAGSEEDHLTESHRSAAKRMGINLNAKTIRVRLFAGEDPVRGGVLDYVGGELGYRVNPVLMKEWAKRSTAEAMESRAAMGVGSGSIGGYSVPDSPMASLEEALLAFGGMRQVSTILRTDSGSDLPIPTNDDTGNKGAILSENTQVSEVDPTVGQVVLQAYKYSSKSVLVSVEFLQDSSINVPDFIGRKLAQRIGRIQNDHFTTGTGSAQPNGVVTAATSSSVTASGQTSCTYDNIVDLIHTVDPEYRSNSLFMLHDSALKMIRKVKVLQYSGDTVGAPLWVPGVNGLGDTILNYRYVINQSLATVATGTKSVLFGDFSKYYIRDCREVTLIRLDERYADYHQVGFLAFARSDGDLIDAGTHPVKYMTQA
jgi:HK97 family phage major capsid protein